MEPVKYILNLDFLKHVFTSSLRVTECKAMSKEDNFIHLKLNLQINKKYAKSEGV